METPGLEMTSAVDCRRLTAIGPMKITINRRQPGQNGSLGALFLVLLLLLGCSPETPPAAKTPPPGEELVDDGPDETTIALEERLADRKKSVVTVTKKPSARLEPPARPKRDLAADEQWCFGCDGKGEVGCGAPGCREGKVDCPGPCVTRNEGTWVPDPKPGAAPGSMAFLLRFPGIKSTWYVSEFHAGEIWKIENGKLVSAGYCPTCGGARWIGCKVCDTRGLQTCQVCEGKTVLPASWKPTDNPWFNRQPNVVRLKDGRAFLGRDAGGDDVIVMFRTHSGETVSVPRDQVVQWPKTL